MSKKGVGYKRFIDAETGEILDVPIIFHPKPKNNDFDMIFYGHLLDILNDLGNKKIRVLQHIIKNRSKDDNVFIGTQKDIAASLDINIMTVNKTLVFLEDKQVIKRKTGVIYIDADLVADGRFKGNIMHVYNGVEEETPENKKSRLEREIERKEKEILKMKSLKDQIKIPTLEVEFEH